MPSDPVDAKLYRLDSSPDRAGYMTFPPLRRLGNVVVVGDVMLLRQPYDAAQRWFPFMTGTILAHQEPEAEVAGDYRINLTNEHEWDTIDHKNEYPALYQRHPTTKRGVAQFCLPFHEYREITLPDIQHIHEGRYPTFECDADGNIHTIYFRREDDRAMRQYLRDTCVGRYFIDDMQRSVDFELEEDAVAVKLMFR